MCVPLKISTHRMAEGSLCDTKFISTSSFSGSFPSWLCDVLSLFSLFLTYICVYGVVWHNHTDTKQARIHISLLVHVSAQSTRMHASFVVVFGINVFASVDICILNIYNTYACESKYRKKEKKRETHTQKEKERWEERVSLYLFLLCEKYALFSPNKIRKLHILFHIFIQLRDVLFILNISLSFYFRFSPSILLALPHYRLCCFKCTQKCLFIQPFLLQTIYRYIMCTAQRLIYMLYSIHALTIGDIFIIIIIILLCSNC